MFNPESSFGKFLHRLLFRDVTTTPIDTLHSNDQKIIRTHLKYLQSHAAGEKLS
jgi:hypothetical protein